jgi:hypothetical protein
MAKKNKIKTQWKKRHTVFEWIWLWRGVRVVAWLALLAGLGAAWHFGVPELEKRAQAQRPSELVTVQFLNAPAWFQGDIASSITLTIQDIATTDPFDQQQLERITQTLAASGWFERINQVRRVPPNVIEVDAVFVRPFAMIRGADADFLVDPLGRRLPMQIDSSKPQQQFIVIAGAQMRQPPRLGEHWPGADVIAGLQLIRLVDAAPWRHQVSAIDVANHRRHRTVAIVTDHGTNINFEHAPGEEEPLELSAEQKMQLLAHNYRTHGHIAGTQLADLRFSGGALYSQR